MHEPVPDQFGPRGNAGDALCRQLHDQEGATGSDSRWRTLPVAIQGERSLRFLRVLRQRLLLDGATLDEPVTMLAGGDWLDDPEAMLLEGDSVARGEADARPLDEAARLA